MKTWRIVAVLATAIFVSVGSAAAQVTVSGNLKDVGATAITSSNTYARFELKNYGGNIPKVTGTTIIAKPLKDFKPDSTGAISGSLYGNDAITPSGTYYQACIYDAGSLLRCAAYTITGSSFNLNTATPITSTPVTPVTPTQVSRAFEHSQASAATTWTINHNFGDQKVVCQFFDSNQQQLFPDAFVRTSGNVATATFTVAQAGFATCYNTVSFSLVSGVSSVVSTIPTANQVIQGQFLLTLDTLIVSKLDNIRLVCPSCRFTTIQAAHDDIVGNNGRIVVAAPLTVSAATNITKSGVTIEFLPNAILTKAAGTFAAFIVTGSDFEMRDGVIDATAATAGDVFQANSGSNIRVLNMKITNAGASAINLHNVSDFLVANNTISTTGASSSNSIFIRNGSARGKVIGNHITVTGGIPDNADAIVVIAEAAQPAPTQVSVLANTIQIGSQQFGIEVGNFGGTSNPRNITVANNVIRATALFSGGISIASTDGAAVSGNVIDANGQDVQIALVETVVSTGIAVSGNHLFGSAAQVAKSLTIDRSNSSTYTGNVIDGFGNAVNGAGIHLVVASATNPTARRNVISGNHILFPTSSANTHRGIWVQAANASADISNNVIANNTITGNGGVATQGIFLAEDSGTLDNTLVIGNMVSNVNIGINRNAAQSNAQLLLNDLSSSVTTTYGGSAGTNERLLDYNATELAAKRIKTSPGTALVAGDFGTPSAGCGSTASISAVSTNSRDQNFEFDLTSAGTGQGLNTCTVTVTFKDGTFTNAPRLVCQRNDLVATAGRIANTTISATAPVLTFVGTPVAGDIYKIACTFVGN